MRSLWDAHALDHTKPFGEPYELLGKRIVFNTWYYVRPGQPQWYDPQTGKELSTSATAGPFDASFRYLEGPFGIRLIAEPAERVAGDIHLRAQLAQDTPSLVESIVSSQVPALHLVDFYEEGA